MGAAMGACMCAASATRGVRTFHKVLKNEYLVTTGIGLVDFDPLTHLDEVRARMGVLCLDASPEKQPGFYSPYRGVWRSWRSTLSL